MLEVERFLYRRVVIFRRAPV